MWFVFRFECHLFILVIELPVVRVLFLLYKTDVHWQLHISPFSVLNYLFTATAKQITKVKVLSLVLPFFIFSCRLKFTVNFQFTSS